MNELEQMKEAYKDMLENISLEQFEEYKKELTSNTFCVICKNNINGDSQFIKGKWYHNDCIENLTNENERLNNIIDELEKYLQEKIKYMETHSIERMVAYDDSLYKLKKLKEGK